MPVFLFAVVIGLGATLAWVLLGQKPIARVFGGIAQPPPIPAAAQPRDPVSAIAALQLAHAYIREVQDNAKSLPGNAAMAAHLLNELSLASKQLAVAEAADATATLSDDEHGTFSLADLKARALFFEAVCRSEADAKRAIRILHQAIALDPLLAPAHYWIGSLEAGLFHKPQAIAAFERAIALDPANLDYKMELGRAHNISMSQIAFERAVSGTRFGVRAVKILGACFAAVIVLIIAVHLADPATRLATIVILVIGSGCIMGFIDTIKVMWANVSGQG